MPELPEVQTVVNYIKPLCIGKKLIRVKPVWSKVLHNFNEGFNSDFKNNEVRDIYRRAKFIIIKSWMNKTCIRFLIRCLFDLAITFGLDF